MLNRNDLTKQFELVVKQEIKNYQDSLNQVLQSIRDLKEAIEDARHDFLENHAALHSHQGQLAGELESIRFKLENLARIQAGHANTQHVTNEHTEKQLMELKDFINNKGCQDDWNKLKFSDIETNINKIKLQHDLFHKLIGDQTDYLLSHCKSSIDKAKQEIKDAPSDASLIKAEIREELNTFKVDTFGLLRELRLLKNDSMVQEKKIENIYTLIDRLKKSEGEK